MTNYQNIMRFRNEKSHIQQKKSKLILLKLTLLKLIDEPKKKKEKKWL